MAIQFRSASTIAANATTTTLTIDIPAGTVENDVMLAFVLNKDNQVLTFPGGWTKFVEVNNTADQRATVAWKRATASEPATYAITKPVDNNILFCGFIASFSGCLKTESPVDTGTGTPTTNSAAVAQDAVNYTDITPTENNSLVCAIAFYNEDNTTFDTITGSTPTFTINSDQETPTGTDGSICLESGILSTAQATGNKTHASSSATDAINIGVLLALLPEIVIVNPILDPFNIVVKIIGIPLEGS